MRQFFHFDGVLDDFAFAVKGKTGCSLADRNSVEINFRTESPVQFNLTLAKVVAFFQRAEIQKAEIHRLLHFEDKRRRNEDPRDVSLSGANFGWIVRVRRRRFEKSSQFLCLSIWRRCHSERSRGIPMNNLMA